MSEQAGGVGTAPPASAATSSVPKRTASGQQGRRKTKSSENGGSGILRSSRSTPVTGDRTVKKLRLSKALTIPDTTTVADACRRMANRRVAAALLTDSDALLCGIITDKDVATRVIAEGLVPEETLVSTVMTKNPIFVMTDTLAVDALQKMVQGKFRHLPVVEKGEVVALLDITKCLYDAIARMEQAAEKGNALAAAVEDIERQWGNNLAASSSYVDSLRDRVFRPNLASVITETTKVATVSSVDTVYTATRKMSELRVSSVVITNGNKPSGIFTSKDVLMRVVAKNLAPDTTVDKVMSPNPECATLNTTIVDALHLMHNGKFLHLPVVDQDGHLVACVDVLQLTHGAVSMVGNNGAGIAGDLASTMLQKFWDTAFALEPPDMEEDRNSDLSAKLASENSGLDMRKISTSPSGSRNSFLFKLEDQQGHVHRFNCGTSSLTELTSTIMQRVGEDSNHLEVPHVLYEDDEGDRVLLTTDSDLVAAVNFARTSGWKGLRLFLEYPNQINVLPTTVTTSKEDAWGSTQTTMVACAVAVVGVGLFLCMRKFKGDLTHLLHWG
ncbi:hypothetical protein O6H91_09G083800 [Diphasiastrum complanatum]|uniref:Uncharacterized protein n=4 Tax=Diphasiastrum complanatum TaxID=34168 RepID=A0ACC2CNG3_DIPCM|nr:hypothetical protein O6H91_09G044300 [Diphasiastrum complanatum]KAJ7543585.1 hypothetical protein O6H91_09G044300 [Diphasiastrum complanatum]KAJ7543586.1 hypothetical protein O6H91_09G044300 [Diphasiastrum complanatum]KAJ7544581.1 hypothetical protein O6H91_09G083800 [Diphasiastrum complanatum]